MERHSQQPAAALDRGRRPGERVPPPSNNSNGNTFDFQGRQLSCEHLTRRVVRYEHDGSVTVIADTYNGKRLNSPNDVVPHPDGSYWFTDPPYGGQLYEGAPDAPAGRETGRPLKRRLGQPAGIGAQNASCRPTVSRRSERSHRPRRHRGQVPDPNGIASRPTTRRSTSSARGRGRATPGPAAKATCMRSTSEPITVTNRKLFSRLHGRRREVRRTACAATSTATSGHRATPAASRLQRRHRVDAGGKLIGRIRLPEVCGNLCFGGPKRNRLFMAASQSLYAVYVGDAGGGARLDFHRSAGVPPAS